METFEMSNIILSVSSKFSCTVTLVAYRTPDFDKIGVNVVKTINRNSFRLENNRLSMGQLETCLVRIEIAQNNGLTV